MTRGAAAVALVLLLGACGGDGPARPEAVPASAAPVPPATDDRPFAEQRPGNPAVYERIEALTDCLDLQDELDTAMANAELREPGDPIRTVSIAYATFAAERLDELGCA